MRETFRRPYPFLYLYIYIKAISVTVLLSFFFPPLHPSANLDTSTNILLYSHYVSAHVVKDYTNKAKTDMFLPLSES